MNINNFNMLEVALIDHIIRTNMYKYFNVTGMSPENLKNLGSKITFYVSVNKSMKHWFIIIIEKNAEEKFIVSYDQDYRYTTIDETTEKPTPDFIECLESLKQTNLEVKINNIVTKFFSFMYGCDDE